MKRQKSKFECTRQKRLEEGQDVDFDELTSNGNDHCV